MNAVNAVALKLLPTTDVYTTKQRYLEVRRYIESLKTLENRLKGEPHVFRMIDLDCREGIFGAFAAVRFPYAWIDAYHHTEDDEATRKLARVNMQIGTRFFDGYPDELPVCDALHVGFRARFGVGKKLQFSSVALEQLRLAIWDWEDSARLETATGFMRAIGLDVMHVQTYAPGTGWALYFRTRPWSGTTDLTRKPASTPS